VLGESLAMDYQMLIKRRQTLPKSRPLVCIILL